jgi:DNA invertase Pin-like site-specific DNA recombinase
MKMKYGYYRTSSQSDKLLHQCQLLRNDVDEVVYDIYALGTEGTNGKLTQLLSKLAEGDELVVIDLDNAFVDKESFQLTLKYCTESGVILSACGSTYTSNPKNQRITTEATSEVIHFISRKEDEFYNTTSGAKKANLPDNFEEVYNLYRSDEFGSREAARRCHMSAGTFMDRVRAWEK